MAKRKIKTSDEAKEEIVLMAFSSPSVEEDDLRSMIELYGRLLIDERKTPRIKREARKGGGSPELKTALDSLLRG